MRINSPSSAFAPPAAAFHPTCCLMSLSPSLRPSAGREPTFTATFFYAEVDGRPEEPRLERAFDELRFFSDHFEVLGVYPADPFRARS